jgi:hypothetical protein
MVRKQYPQKCWCGVTLDTRMEMLDHDCNNWEYLLKEEASEKI